jgi:hypothetical protein
MVGNGEELPDKMVEEIQREVERKSLVHPVWPGRPKEERGTTACGMTRVLRKMNLGMAPPMRRHHPKLNSRCPAE